MRYMRDPGFLWTPFCILQMLLLTTGNVICAHVEAEWVCLATVSLTAAYL